MRFLRSKKVINMEDAALVDAFKKSGDGEYLGVLFDRYSHLVFAVSMKYLHNEEESKDVVMHIFEKLAADLKKYQVDNFSHWLYVITRNHCLRLLRNKSYPVHITDDIPAAVENTDEEAALISDRMLSNLDEAVSTLNEVQQKCIKLFYFEEKSYKEIESLTGFTYKEVKTHIQNGKRNLRIF